MALILLRSLGNSTHIWKSIYLIDFVDISSNKQGAHLSTTNVKVGYVQLVDIESLHSLSGIDGQENMLDVWLV